MAVKLVKNPVTGKFEVQVPEKKVSVSGKSTYDPTIAYVAVKREKIDAIAKMLGFVANAATDKGKQAQKTSIATQWLNAILDEAIAVKPAPAKTGK